MKYKLQHLVDMEHFQDLQDRLNEICSFPSSIIDNDGNILTATAWQDICSQFHRKNKECEKICIKSDQYITDHIHEANPAVSYRCPHGLVDNATPIVIDGIHYGNFFTGQFFLEKPDMEFFRTQAQKYGFDEDAYLKAVRKVPIWTQEQLNSYLFFIKGLITVISEIGLKNLKEMETRKLIEASEKRHRSILKSAMDGYWLTDTEGRLIEVNNAYCLMSGYSEDELLTMRISDLEAVENPQLVSEHMQKVVFQGSDRFESKHRRKDGTVFDVEISIQFRPEEGGQCVCFFRDVTGPKQAEKSLRVSEKKYRTIFENMAQGVFYQRADGVLIDYNQAALEMFGLTPEQFIGKTSIDPQWKVIKEDGKILPGDEHPSMIALQTGKPVKDAIVGVYNPRSRNYKWLIVNAIPQFNKAGEKPYQVFVTLQDITDRRQSERQYQMLFRKMLDGFALHEIICDDAGHPVDYRFLVVNPAFEKMTGLKAAQIVNRTVLDVLPGIERHWIETYGNVALSGEPAFFENYAADIGKHFQVTAFRPAPDQFACIFSDITERKRAEREKENLEDQLRQAQKMEAVGRLAGGVAHDFNNMLSVIIGHAGMAMEMVDPAHPLYADLEEIRKAGERSADLTRQLLAFARKQTVSPKVLDLNKTVAGMTMMLQRLIGEDIDLAWLPGEKLWPVKMDPSQIDQILVNLCVNARDAIADVGKVTIATGNAVFDETNFSEHAGFWPGEYVLLAVSDNGCGMDTETLGNLFEPFFTTKESGKGTGLGLATVYGVAKQNNGFVNVCSEPDQGTTFRIYLPRHLTQTARLPEKGRDQTAERGHETILLVEDEPAILRMTTMMLERLGYTVVAASTPGEAIGIAQGYTGEIHLLVTDVVMPEMNGRDLAKNIVSIHPNLKRLFMSGYTANVIAHHGALDEGVNFIPKPFSRETLGAEVRKVLDAVKV